MKTYFLLLALMLVSCSSCDKKIDSQGDIEIVWKTAIPEDYYTITTPAVAGETLIFITQNGEFNGFSIYDGSPKWKAGTGLGKPQANSIITYGENLYYDFFSRTISFNTIDGSFNWSFLKSLPSNHDPEILEDDVFTGSLYADDPLINDGYVYCLDRVSGNQKWARHIARDAAKLKAVPEENRLYVATRWWNQTGSTDGLLLCLNSLNGDSVWSYDAGSGIFGKPNIWQNYILITTEDGKVICINRNDGKEFWSFKAKNGFNVGVTVDSVSNLGYSVANYIVYCFDLQTGNIIWTQGEGSSDPRDNNPPFGTVFHEVVLYKGVIYFFQVGGTLTALDALNGKILYQSYQNYETPFRSGLVIADNKIFVLGNQYIYALKPLR